MGRDPKKHLTEDEFIDFILIDLPGGEAEAVDQHLEQCVVCMQELEEFYEAQEQFPAQRWAAERSAFIARLRSKIFDRPTPLEKLKTFLESISFPASLAKQFSTKRPDPLDFESEDRSHGFFVEEEFNGDMIVRFDSTATELEGITIRVFASDWHKDVRLERVNDTQLGAQVVISNDEIGSLPPKALFCATVVG